MDLFCKAQLSLWLVILACLSTDAYAVIASEKLNQNVTTANHSEFKTLQKQFHSGPEVTKACLECHTEAAKQVQQSLHWTWEYVQPKTFQTLGKRHVINSFCGSVTSNEPRCTSCHAGYGWTDMQQPPPTDETSVDCLVCHDTTGEYVKLPAGAGHPAYKPMESPAGSGHMQAPTDLTAIAQNVGHSQPANCGSCHFYGGGGDGVKHGDLDSSLVNPPKSLDVHLSHDGANLTCSDCHTTSGHITAGSRYQGNAHDTLGIDVPGHTDMSRASCESCHGPAPHDKAKLNEHVDRVACQSCHIPAFARGGVATKTWWDWSTAGRLDENNKPITLYDENGHLSYLSIKGDFQYAENVTPDYRWFNGTVHYTLQTDTIDTDNPPVQVNWIEGSAKDPDSRIWPFKIMHGKQPFDTVNKTLLVNHVYSPTDDSALWSNFDWTKALQAGTTIAGQPYSGQFDFIETEMYWPISHMVGPADSAVKCSSCHASNSRLNGIPDIYIPARDHSSLLDKIGWGTALLMLIGSAAHAGGRGIAAVRRRRKKS
nr:tetrathionate reductase family octaheme c-type cytochrome [uncultured Amphritea sp.]